MTAGMLPAREAPAAAPRLPATAAARVVEVEVVPRERREALQQAAQVAVERMAAKRHWPQVEIFVPAGTGRQEGAC